MKARAALDYRLSRDGPWPAIEIGGDLPRAEREWVHTNGAGAYAMSTAALMNTRRQHGIFVAALPAPLGRHVIMTHADTTITVGADRRTYRLSTHQFPGVAPTPGYRHLQRFSIDPVPRWVFQLGGHVFERALCFVRGKNALIMAFTWRGKGLAMLQLRPLMPLRPADGLMREHGGMVQVLSLRPRAVEMRPVSCLPAVVFGHEGVFMGSPDWWRRFEYLSDQADGLPFEEDIWTPGIFEMALEPDRTVYLCAAIDHLPEGSASELFAAAFQEVRAQDPGEARPDSIRALSVAAEQFCLDAAREPSVIAGYPSHAILVRDWVMSLTGLTVARERVDLAERSLSTLLRALRGGLLPELLPEPGEPRAKPLPDATLLLFDLARELEQHVGAHHPILRSRLFPALVRVYARFRSGRGPWVWSSADGLLVNGAADMALTWMDAHLGARPITRRAGLAVEQQAFWTRGCETLSRLAAAYGMSGLSEAASKTSARARAAFQARFWCAETEYPFDCLSDATAPGGAWADSSIRPNALIALSADPDLFQYWQAEAILRRVREELLTPRGIRSLSPRDRSYIGSFGGPVEDREAAYHQGTAWTHLLGAYARASLRAAPDDMDVYYEVRNLLEHALDDGVVLGQVGQLADGDPPHRPRGCPAQASSVAELLRALALDLDI